MTDDPNADAARQFFAAIPDDAWSIWETRWKQACQDKTANDLFDCMVGILGDEITRRAIFMQADAK